MFRAKSKIFSSLDELKTYLTIIETSKYLSSIYRDEFIIEELNYKKNPPHLNAVSGIEIQYLDITGELNPIDWDSITQVLSTLENNIGMTGRVKVAIRYDEPDHELSNDAYECVSIINENGKYFFSYSFNATRAALDREVGIKQIENIVQVMQLPISLIREDNNNFILEHSNGLTLEIHDSHLFNKNPTSFTCEIDLANIGELIGKLKLFVDNFIWNTITDVDWHAGYSVRSDNSSDSLQEANEKKVEIYNTAIDHNLPAQSFYMCPSFKLITLDDIQTLRTFCAENHVFTVRIGVMVFTDLRVLVSIGVSSDGYRIQAGTADKEAIDKLSSVLNIEFEDN
ncbi:hypothetical protein [uncultured Cocleimonas sp.]|uniref:hypothetical protein n=1 Tax=uncultured Cocleimonas sp. TaxID=1051587 RepID=UPI0026217911|nr:hypothetical protein [uncultured Cocleimonas sp.]